MFTGFEYSYFITTSLPTISFLYTSTLLFSILLILNYISLSPKIVSPFGLYRDIDVNNADMNSTTDNNYWASINICCLDGLAHSGYIKNLGRRWYHMHTYVLSKIIDKNMYDKIINSTPHYFLETTSTHFSLAIIINDRLSIPDDEKNSLPAIYLYCFEETKIINGKKIKTGIYHHMLELRINYTKIIGNTGFYSIPVEFTKSIVHQSIIDLVCKAVPEIYELNDNLISLYSHLKLIYQKIYPKHPIPDIVDIVTTLSKSNDEQIQQFMKNHFSEPQIFSMDISKETKQRIIDHDYPLEFLLKRIDYSCDIYTDYKNILLGLISKGYDVKQFADDTRIYYNKEEDIIESNYYKSKSVHINIYDKFSELKTHNEYILPEDEDRLPYLLRFEVQLLKNRLSYSKQREINKNGKQIERKLDDFISNNKEYENLNYYMKRLIGLGNYYCFPVAINIVNDSNYKNNMKKNYAEYCIMLQNETA